MAMTKTRWDAIELALLLTVGSMRGSQIS